MNLKAALFVGMLLGVAGCSVDEPTLPGDRETLPGATNEQSVARFIADNPAAFQMPRQTQNASWTHSGGNAQHNLSHPTLAASLTQLWSAPIGQGDGRRHQITASPVVSAGRIFTLDSRALVSATATNGGLLWQADLTVASDSADDASGGGLAVDANHVYVTTGFGRISALDVATGATVWTQDLSSFGGASPTVFDGLVYLTARDGSAWAINADDGTIAWQISGPEGLANHVGGPGVAVTSKWAIFPFGTGEVYSTFRRGGLRNWTSVLSGARTGQAAGSISDLTGHPIVQGNRVYLANSAGRTAALNLGDGTRAWTANQGSTGEIWVAGNAIFAVSDQNQLIRLSKETGVLVWSNPLARFTNDNVKRRKAIVAHFGPILAGGRLIVVSSDEQLRQFDANDGSLISQTALEDGAASAPVVAGGTLFVVTRDGNLVAFR